MAKQGAPFSKVPSPLVANTTSNPTTVPLVAPAQPATSNILHHFSKSQLALAFTIEKSRPNNVSTIEYCQRLRKRIKTGRNIPNEEHRYIDTPEFWKDEYNKIYLEKRNIEDKCNRLEEELRLRAEAGLHTDPEDPQTRPSNVRQLVAQSYYSTNDEPQGRQLPHNLLELSGGQLNEEIVGALPVDDNLLRMSRYVHRIYREHNSLKNITQYLDLSNIQAAISQNRELLLLLENAITQCCTPLRFLKTNTKDFHTLNLLRQLMRQISLVVQSSFDFLNVLCQTIAGRDKRNHVVYRIAMFFDKALKILRDLSSMQSANENKESGSVLLHRPSKKDEFEYVVNKYLAGALSSTIASFKWETGKPGHRAVLEGILYTVLEHTGRLVSEAVFKEHVESSDNPGNITESMDKSTSRTMSLESRYIVGILYAALGGPEKKSLVAKVLASENGSHTQRQLVTSDLISKKTNLIQSMLVKSAIGGDEFESLKFPAPPLDDAEIPIATNIDVEPYGPDWLVEMVWAMVGWDTVV